MDRPRIQFHVRRAEVLLLFFGHRSGRRRWYLGGLHRRRRIAAHAFLEMPDPFAQALHNFRNLFAAEQEHNYG